MRFYDSGGRAYGVFQTSKDLVPDAGYHLPGKMGGVWFGPVRVISSLEIDGFGNAIDVSYENWGRRIVFERGEVLITIPRFEEAIYFEFRGFGKVTVELDGTKVWLSERLGWKDEVPKRVGDRFRLEGYGKDLFVQSTSKMVLKERGFEFSVNGNSAICVSFRKCDASKMKEKMDKRERSLLERIPGGWGSTEGSLKSFVFEMFLETDHGMGFMAGLEEYPWWFTIDTSFLTPFALESNLSDLLKDSLLNILKKTETIPPHEIVSNGVVNEVFNEVELFSFLHSVFTYTHVTGDVSLLEDSRYLLKTASEILEGGFPSGYGMVENGKQGKWLDISSYAFAMLRSYDTLKKEGVLHHEPFDSALEFFEKNFIKHWFDEKRGVFRDLDGEVHFTQSLPLYFELVPESVGRIVLRSLKDMGMITEKGLKHSLQRLGNEGYYGEKSEKVWWIANALLRRSARLYGGLNVMYLEDLFLEDLGKFKTPPEIVGGGGCFAQLWSVLMISG